MIAKGPKCGRLFPLYFPAISRNKIEFPYSCFPQNNVQLWHNRLGHPNSKGLLSLMKSSLVNNISISAHDVTFDCSTCKMGKSKTLPFSTHDSLCTNCFDLIHSDVWGISPVISHSLYKYFVTFIDDHIRFTWTYFLKEKSEVFDAFKTFLAYVENHFSTCIKTLCSNSGGESMFHINFKTFYNNVELYPNVPVPVRMSIFSFSTLQAPLLQPS